MPIYSFPSKNEMVRNFGSQKFEAFGVSVLTLIWWFSFKETSDGSDWSQLLSSNALPYLVSFLLALSSWHLNNKAESACVAESSHTVYYVGQATIQDYILFVCVGLLALSVVYHIAETVWFILSCVGVALILLWKFKYASKIFKWVMYVKRQGITQSSNQVPDATFLNLLCMIIRYAAIIYTCYYLFFK